MSILFTAKFLSIGFNSQSFLGLLPESLIIFKTLSLLSPLTMPHPTPVSDHSPLLHSPLYHLQVLIKTSVSGLPNPRPEPNPKF